MDGGFFDAKSAAAKISLLQLLLLTLPLSTAAAKSSGFGRV